jgi:hypothetical protein
MSAKWSRAVSQITCIVLRFGIELALSTTRSHRNRSRQKTNFASKSKLIWVVKPPRRKYRASLFPKFVFSSSHPRSMRGVRVVTDVERGMRWTRSCVSTSAIFADGEVVWSWHPGAGVKFAILFDEPVNDGGNQAGPRGEHV